MMAARLDIHPFITHMERQLASASQLLNTLEQQFEAIHKQDVQAVMNSVFAIQAEMARRQQLEQERSRLLAQAADYLVTTADEVTVDALTALAGEAEAEQLRGHSQALRHLLNEVGRRYRLNRELIEQELQFVSFMLDAVGEPQRTGAYGRAGAQPQAPVNPTSILDIKG